MLKAGCKWIYLLVLLIAPELAAQVILSPNPSRVLGHPQATLKTANPNYIEGRELYGPYAVAIDSTTSPPILYVADTINNRVLAWRNAANFQNGAQADLVIGQQDFFSTTPLGPGTTFQTGLSYPTGLAVSPQGDLFVADAGNNRILRYPRPFNNPLPAFPDFVIGQPDMSTRTANRDRDTNTISDRTLYLISGSNPFVAPLLFDPDGNLFVADAGNQRVLRFPADRIRPGASSYPRADLVLGQPSFTQTSPSNPSSAADLTLMGVPACLGMDFGRRLYVCDSYHRVLVYPAVIFSGASAQRRIGGGRNAQGNLQPPTNQTLYQPSGIFFVNDRIYVADSGNHRILRFPRFQDWPETSLPTAEEVIGQVSFTEYNPNRGAIWPVIGTEGSPTVSFSFPSAAVYYGGEVFLSDTGNNRLLVLSDPATTAGSAIYGKRVLGQPFLDANGVNRVEERGFFLGMYATGLAIDARSNPPRLYVADTLNNRVLGFRDARTAKLGQPADIVLGQESFYRSVANWGPSNPGQPNAYGLNMPQGLAVDSSGNLWVADSGNGRVLRFPDPFQHGSSAPADLVLGKPDFSTTRGSRPDPTDENFSYPVGLAFTTGGHLLVSDAVFNRVLLFFKPAGGFQTHQRADRVYGQTGFFERTAAASESDRLHFNTPLHISVDQGDRLFICDFGMNRVLILDSITERPSGTSADHAITDLGSQLGRIQSPRSVYSSPATGDTWIASGTSGRGSGLIRIPGTATTPNFFVGAGGDTVLGVTATASGEPLVALATHRVAFYSPAVTITNAANYQPEIAPGMYATLWPFTGFRFPVNAVIAPGIPLPKELEDLQILINGVAAPLHYVSATQINFITPMSMPTSGDLDVQLVRKSTGEILAVGCTQNSSRTACQDPYLPLQASAYSVGLFTSDNTGLLQVRALMKKADGNYYGNCTSENIAPCLNSPTNPVKGGDYLELYLTGQGLDAGTYEDGAAPGPSHNTARLPQVFIGPQRKQLPDSDIVYSGLNQFYPGLWQINIKIPSGDGAPIGNQVPIQVIYRSSDSWRGTKLIQTIAVTQ